MELQGKITAVLSHLLLWTLLARFTAIWAYTRCGGKNKQTNTMRGTN